MPWLVWLLMSFAGSIVARILISLGMTFVIVQGMDQLTDFLILQINNAAGQIPADMGMILGRLGIFSAMSIMVSAYVASLSVLSAMNGIKRLVFSYNAQ